MIGRRDLLKLLGASAGLAVLPGIVKSMPPPKGNKNFLYSLNTATIREQNLGLIGELENAAAEVFDGV